MTNTDDTPEPRIPTAGSLEIERKYLLDALPAGLESLPSCKILQGYLVVTADFEARLRKKDLEFFLTIKKGEGRTRHETEISVSEEQFAALWPLTEGRRVEKVRYFQEFEQYVIEYDVYSGDLEGLFVAEIEFPTEEDCDAFVPPVALGTDITGDKRYANKNLALSGAR